MRRSPTRGLYDPASEHDSCGFGLIAQVDGKPSRAIVEGALAALSRMAHRGGVAADGLSGDGCGVLLHGAQNFVRTLAEEAGIALQSAQFAAGNVFLPQAAVAAAQCREALEAALVRSGVQVAGWRTVPVDTAVCGALARATCPRIEQVFVASDGADAQAFERALFLARKHCEQRLREYPEFYITS
ncbi:MAG TPA: glutamate synthase large subunit, partial [Thermomonas sp.]|nr:glutamate synthase large subunit [Thermomonas sp.]